MPSHAIMVDPARPLDFVQRAFGTRVCHSRSSTSGSQCSLPCLTRTGAFMGYMDDPTALLGHVGRARAPSKAYARSGSARALDTTAAHGDAGSWQPYGSTTKAESPTP